LQRCAIFNPARHSHRDLQLCLQVTAIKSSLETKVLPKLRSLESMLQLINRLPTDVFVLMLRFLTREKEVLDFKFPDNSLLITITHVCRSRRDVLLSTRAFGRRSTSPSAESQQAEVFLRQSGNQLLDIYHHLNDQDNIEPFISITLHNLFRLRRPSIISP